MRKYVCVAALVAVVCLGRPTAAATLVNNPVSLPNTGGLALQAGIGDPKTLDLIDKVNEYAFAQLLIDSGEAARNHFNDRIHWEFHLGAAEGLYPGAQGALPDYADGGTGTESFFTVGLRYNLTNPKMVKAYDVLAELKRLHNLLQVRSFPFNEELDGECQRMIADTQAYLDAFWFKRWAIGVDFPYSTRGFSYNSQVNTNFPGGYTYTSANYGNTGSPGFDFGNPFVVLATDMGDFLSLEVGYSAKNQVMVGISTDISTAMFTLGTDFFSYIRSFSGAPNAGAYPAGVH